MPHRGRSRSRLTGIGASPSPYVVQRVRTSFRIHDRPDDATPMAGRSTLRVDDQIRVKDVAPGEGADLDFNNYVGGNVTGVLRVVVVDRHARDDGLVG